MATLSIKSVALLSIALTLPLHPCAAQSIGLPGATLQFDAGYAWENLPTPAFGTAVSVFRDIHAAGPNIGISAGIPLGSSQDAFTLTWDGQASRLAGSSAGSRSLGSGNFEISLGKPAGGFVNLVALTAIPGSFAAADVAFTDSTGDAVSIVTVGLSPPGANFITQYSVSPTTKGLAFAGLTTDGETPMSEAYGAFADDRGLRLIGAGGGTVILDARSTVRQDRQVQTIWLGRSPQLANDEVRFKVGAAYRSSRQFYTSSTSLEFPGSPAGAAIPAINVEQSGDFDLDAVGLLVGIDRSFHPLSKVSFAVNASVGIMGFHARSSTSSFFDFPMAGPIASQTDLIKDGCFGVAALDAAMAVALSENVSVQFGVGANMDFQAPRPNARSITSQTVVLSDLSIALTATF